MRSLSYYKIIPLFQFRKLGFTSFTSSGCQRLQRNDCLLSQLGSNRAPLLGCLRKKLPRCLSFGRLSVLTFLWDRRAEYHRGRRLKSFTGFREWIMRPRGCSETTTPLHACMEDTVFRRGEKLIPWQIFFRSPHGECQEFTACNGDQNRL